jgi:hypothetical protein
VLRKKFRRPYPQVEGPGAKESNAVAGATEQTVGGNSSSCR